LWFRNQAHVISAPIRGDKEVGIQAGLLRFQNNHLGGLLAIPIHSWRHVPPDGIANLWFADDLFASLQLDNANAQRRADHNGKTRAKRVHYTTVRTSCRRHLATSPRFAHSDSLECGRAKWHVCLEPEILWNATVNPRHRS